MTLSIAIALVEHGGLWLVDRRRTDDEFDGLWEFPGGKIRPGETPTAAAVRECAEEVGLQVMPQSELETVYHEYSLSRVALHPVVCLVVGGEAFPKAPEIAEIRWTGLEDLCSLEMPAANRAIIRQLQAWMHGQS